MTDNRPADDRENQRTVYKAVVDYHNSLVQTRFTIAGLYIAATGFLASSWFANLRSQRSSAYWLIPVLGLVLTLACWLLEIRTDQLLRNLGSAGEKIEEDLQVEAARRFFALLMHSQEQQPWLPFTSIELPKWKIGEKVYIVSHSFGLDILYLSILLFWIFVSVLN
jgi:hypothetical protein